MLESLIKYFAFNPLDRDLDSSTVNNIDTGVDMQGAAMSLPESASSNITRVSTSQTEIPETHRILFSKADAFEAFYNVRVNPDHAHNLGYVWGKFGA